MLWAPLGQGPKAACLKGGERRLLKAGASLPAGGEKAA